MSLPASLPIINSPAGTYSKVIPSCPETSLLPMPNSGTGVGARVTVLAGAEFGVVVAVLVGLSLKGGRIASVSGGDVGTGELLFSGFLRLLYASPNRTIATAATPRIRVHPGKFLKVGSVAAPVLEIPSTVGTLLGVSVTWTEDTLASSSRRGGN